MIFDHIERDDDNLDHATRRAIAAEIEQVIFNARRAVPHRHHPDRVMLRSSTDGGRRLIVVARSCETDCGRSRHGKSDDER